MPGSSCRPGSDLQEYQCRLVVSGRLEWSYSLALAAGHQQPFTRLTVRQELAEESGSSAACPTSRPQVIHQYGVHIRHSPARHCAPDVSLTAPFYRPCRPFRPPCSQSSSLVVLSSVGLLTASCLLFQQFIQLFAGASLFRIDILRA